MKKYILSALSLMILSSCSSDVTNNTDIANVSQISAQSTKSRVENMVNKSRMENNLGVFAGKNAFNDKKIPERGGVEGRDMTRAFLKETLENLGYKVELHNYRKNGTNVVTKLMADESTDEYIVVGAHMDSVRNSGADDNASGSTAVLEAATVLKDLKGRKINIIFAWFDEEELGLIGSNYLASDYKKQKMKIISAHTLDMIGYDKDNDNNIELGRPDGILWDYYNMVNKSHNLNYKLIRTNTGSSDHVSFHDKGFNSICLSEEWVNGDSTPYYHNKGDVYDTVNFDFLAAGTKLLVAAVGDLSMRVPGPNGIKIVPHDKFPGRERPFHQH